jgi:hypothetical protein
MEISNAVHENGKTLHILQNLTPTQTNFNGEINEMHEMNNIFQRQSTSSASVSEINLRENGTSDEVATGSPLPTFVFVEPWEMVRGYNRHTFVIFSLKENIEIANVCKERGARPSFEFTLCLFSKVLNARQKNYNLIIFFTLFKGLKSEN